MSTSIVGQALQRLGDLLEYHKEIEILLVGGAAGMITGVLPPTRTTMDCDVMVCDPKAAFAAITTAVELVAKELNLATNWLNGDVQIRLDTLPEEWRERRILIGNFGLLQVWAASRPDLIAMKVLAGRVQDLEDLQTMRVRTDDIKFIQTYLNKLAKKGTSQDQIDDAQIILESLKIHKRE